MDDSDSSGLSSAPSDVERLAPIFLKAKGKKATRKTKKVLPPPSPPSPPRPKRSPSPPHDMTIADNPDIAFIVGFRARFSHAFPPKLPNYGPQDIEQAIVETPLSPQIEDLLCALLGLVLNRKKPVERGHFGRAMEEALSTQKHQWPVSWKRTNPLAGSRTFNDMTPDEKLNLLRTLVLWSLTSSDAISQTIKDSYKQARREDDLNQPLSIQPLGQDADKRRYWLIEGLEDTSFRLYRESNRYLANVQWISLASNIDEIKQVAEKLETKDTTQAARRVAERIHVCIPRFEQGEEKRRRREYRQIRKAQFSRPEPGFSLYEGRTRGKRIRYTFSDGEEESDATGGRRSARFSGNSTPAEIGPVVTASGRQVRPRGGGYYGETLLSGQVNDTDYAASETSRASGRATRASRRISPLNENRKRELDGSSGEEENASSGNEWDGGDDNDDDDRDDDIEMADAEDDDDDDDMDLPGRGGPPRSLVVKLKISGTRLKEEKPPPVQQQQQQEPDTSSDPLGKNPEGDTHPPPIQNIPPLEPPQHQDSSSDPLSKALETPAIAHPPGLVDLKQHGLTATASTDNPTKPVYNDDDHPPEHTYTEPEVHAPQHTTNGYS